MKQHIINDAGYAGWCHPELSPSVPKEHLVAESGTVLIAADGAIKVAPSGTSVAGFSDVEDSAYRRGLVADGKGGWTAPAPAPIPDAQSAQNWKLSAVLASKGITFAPTDPVIAARWQYEPILAIDGVVAQALATSLSYNEAQLQALFNEAAALK